MNNEAWYLRQMPFAENYESMNKRIDESKSIESLKKVDASLTRCANAKCFLDDDYARLDKKLFSKLIKLEVKSWETH